MIASQPEYPLDYDWLAENITTRELAEIIDCVVSSADGDKLTCYCSHHHDENPSCSFNRVDGRTVVHCFACELSGSPVQAAAIVWDVEEPDAARRLRSELLALRNGTRASMTGSQPMSASTSSASFPKPSLTLDEYATDKLLRKESLDHYGIQEELLRGGTALMFPCKDPEGNTVVRRYRLWMNSRGGRSVFWQKPGTSLYPFGLDKISDWIDMGKKELVLVEGASDALTLWPHGYAAVGIPGAQSFKAEWAAFFDDFQTVYVWRERDSAAHDFVKKIGRTVPDALVLHDADHDDPSDLHLAVNGDRKKFHERFTKLIDAARSISEVVREIDIQQVVVKQGPWPEPQPPDGDPDLDPYPIFNLPHSLYRFVTEVAESTQVATDMVLMATISTVSACVAGKARVAYNGQRPQPLQIWTATVADTGTRKSPVFRLVTGPVKEWEAEEKERTKDERAVLRAEKASLTRRLEALERLASGRKIHIGSQEWKDVLQDQADILKRLEDFPPVSVPRVLANDATSEALVRVMADNHERVFVGSSEADVLRILTGLYSNQPNLGIWKHGYDSDFFIYDRVRDSDSISLDRPALAVTIMLQGVVLQTIRNKRTLAGEGFLGRFIFAVPRSNTGYRNTGKKVSPPDPAAQGEYDRRMKTLLDLPFPDKKKALPVLEFTPDALSILYDLEAELEKELRPEGSLHAISDWANKLFGKTLRLAGVLHLFDAAQRSSLSLVGGGTIGEDIVQAAADLARASIPHALAAYDMLGKDENMETLEYVFKRFQMLAGSGAPVTKNDLRRATKNKASLHNRPSRLDSCIKTLEERAVLRQVKTTGIGRPSVVLVPNPDLAVETATTDLTVTDDPAAGTSGSFGPFDPVSEVENLKISKNSVVEAEKIEGEEAPDEETGSLDPPQEKIQAPEGDELVSDTHDLQPQKDQNSSILDDADAFPPTTELF